MISPTLAAQIRALRQQADASTVPGGLLAWWGRNDFPDGVDRTPCLTQRDWETWYGALQQAALPGTTLAPLPLLKAPTVTLRPDEPVPVALAHFDLQVPLPALRAQALACAAAGTALDEPLPPLSACLAPQRAFLASALLHDQWGHEPPAARGGRVGYCFDRRFFLTNRPGPLPATLDFDAGDGRGFQTVALDSSLDAVYPAGTECAQACVRLRIAGQALCAHFSVTLSAQPAAPAADGSWPLKAANGNTGTAFVYLATNESKLTQPILVAEGFPGGYASDYLYDMLNQHGMADALRAAGHAIVIVGFDNGLDRIQANAQVMQAAIETAMARTGDALVVAGVSMGGLIARYALTEMEAQSRPHRTRIFLTIDTPHGGAYTNVCDQWFAQYFKPASPQAALTAYALDSPANQQFVMHWVHGDQAGPSPLRMQFLSDLVALGNYPQQARRLAVSCGRGDGQRFLAPHQRGLRWTGSPFASAALWTLPQGSDADLVAEGHCLLADGSTAARLDLASAVGWEGAPGGQNVYTAQAAEIARSLGCGEIELAIARNCSVPTVSALDMSISPFAPVPPPGSGTSPFDDYICCEDNQLHLQFTPAVKQWLLDRLDPATPLPAQDRP